MAIPFLLGFILSCLSPLVSLIVLTLI
ncbi:hypothetical protein LINGRAHAP2_LOCUS11507 [Linum grandiflorum]